MIFAQALSVASELEDVRRWSRSILSRARNLAGRAFVLVEWRRALENAQAYLAEPYLRVGLPWLAQMRRRHGWSAVAFILCHELGHTVDFTPFADNWTRELYADEIAGMLLAALGLPLDDAIHFLAIEANCMPCTSHPPAPSRIRAVTLGYRRMLAQTLMLS